MAAVDTKSLEGRRRADRRILIVFFIFLIFSGLTGTIGEAVAGTLSLGSVPAIVSGSFSIAFLVTGIPALIYYAKNGLVSGKKIVKMFLLASLVIAAVLTAAVAIVYFFNMANIDFGEVPKSAAGLASVAAGIYLAGVFGVFIAFLAGMVLAIGAIGAMAALARLLTPRILADIARSERKSYRERAVAWFFCIPDALDVHSLSIGPGARSEMLPWDAIKRAVQWQIILGAVLCVYVSFNTLETGTDPDSMFSMFGMLINLSIFIPLIVLPWFVFLGLDAKLKGTVKDFTLYDGIKSRIFRSYIAISTLLIFVRLTLSRVEAGTYLLGFAAYLVSLAAIATAFTYIYFNFFANELGSDIAVDYETLRRSKQ